MRFPKARLRLRSDVDVMRWGLRLLAETTSRQALKEVYRKASRVTPNLRAGSSQFMPLRHAL